MMYRPPRPYALAGVHRVDGGLYQARCVCRWHGLRRKLNETATADALAHVPNCGLCIREGRTSMDRCTCGNCTRRRDARTRWNTTPTALRPNVPMGTSCHDDPHAPATN